MCHPKKAPHARQPPSLAAAAVPECGGVDDGDGGGSGGSRSGGPLETTRGDDAPDADLAVGGGGGGGDVSVCWISIVAHVLFPRARLQASIRSRTIRSQRGPTGPVYSPTGPRTHTHNRQTRAHIDKLDGTPPANITPVEFSTSMHANMYVTWGRALGRGCRGSLTLGIQPSSLAESAA